MYCRSENQYLTERIVIPDTGKRSYLYRIGEVLQNSGCIWIACHGARNQRNLTVKMLGHTAELPSGAPTIAMRHNAALIPAHTKRLGQFHYQVILGPPIALEGGDNRREAIQSVVQDYADLLGTRLVEQPSSWHWSHAPVACGLV
jgi:lauroyl/myristoyl acyltransferase